MQTPSKFSLRDALKTIPAHPILLFFFAVEDALVRNTLQPIGYAAFYFAGVAFVFGAVLLIVSDWVADKTAGKGLIHSLFCQLWTGTIGNFIFFVLVRTTVNLTQHPDRSHKMAALVLCQFAGASLTVGYFIVTRRALRSTTKK